MCLVYLTSRDFTTTVISSCAITLGNQACQVCEGVSTSCVSVTVPVVCSHIYTLTSKYYIQYTTACDLVNAQDSISWNPTPHQLVGVIRNAGLCSTRGVGISKAPPVPYMAY